MSESGSGQDKGHWRQIDEQTLVSPEGVENYWWKHLPAINALQSSKITDCQHENRLVFPGLVKAIEMTLYGYLHWWCPDCGTLRWLGEPRVPRCLM